MSAPADDNQLSFDSIPEAAEPEAGVGAEPTDVVEAGPVADPEPASEPPPPTPEQAEAIGNRDRDVFLEAGAGTGKTRVLVARYCEAVDADETDPERILAFTFTERAAGEMRRRLRAELTRRANLAAATGDGDRRERLLAASRLGGGATISTIHGFCRRLLASHPVAAGLDPRFRVLGAEESDRLATAAFDQSVAELSRTDDGIALAAAGYRGPRLARAVKGAFFGLRSKGVVPPVLPDIEEFVVDGADADETSPAEADALRGGYEALESLLTAFAERYEVLKAERSAVDFDDLQLIALRLLRENESIAASQRERFDHVLVDEFQDTDPIQLELIHLLSGAEAKLFTVGDEAQSIYGFRGADLDGFRRERERAQADGDGNGGGGGTAALALTGSFRSTPEIVAAVNIVGEALVDDFRHLRVGKPAAEEGGGEPRVELLVTESKDWGKEEHSSEIETAVGDSPQSRIAEARALARRLRELADDGVDPSSMVVLLRAFTHVEAYAEALALADLEPYVVGGRGYWSSQQVADAVRLLTCVANPLDDEALLGALASPACAVSPDTLWMLRRASRRHLWPTIRELSRHEEDAGDGAASDQSSQSAEESDPEREAQEAQRREWAERIPDEERERLRDFHDRLAEIRGRAPLRPLDELVERTLESFGYDLAALQMDNGLQRTANLLKLVRLAGEYDRDEGRDLRGFLRSTAERAALADREAAVAAEDHAGVRIMTIHASKGLEFDCVAVADLGRTLGALGRSPEFQVAGAGGENPRVALQLARPGAPSLRLRGYAEIGEEDADREAAESGRLAYVAASRARSRLLLSGLLEPGWTAAKQAEKKEKKRQQTTIGRLLAWIGVEDLESSSQLRSVPAAEPRPGLEESYPPASVAVRVVRMSAETAAELSRDLRTAAPPTPLGSGSPPMLPRLQVGGRDTTAARHLSYAALTAYRRCGYRFLAERVLGLGSGPSSPAPVDDEMPGGAQGRNGRDDWDEEPASEPTQGTPPEPESGGGTAVGFGRAVHLLLEEAAADGWNPPSPERVLSALAEEGIGAASAEAATAMAVGWLDSSLLAELSEGGATFRTEVPFRIALGDLGEGTVVRGNIDLLATGPGMVPTIVDYKTDRIGEGGPSMSAAYEIQRALYCSAVAEATGAERVRCVHFFLQAPGQPQVAELDQDQIAEARQEAERLAGAIRLGDFRPTDEPHAGLCHDCPARLRLCSHPPEMTLRNL